MHLNDTERTNKLKVIISATRLQLKDTILNQLINKSFLVSFFDNSAWRWLNFVNTREICCTILSSTRYHPVSIRTEF